MEHISKILERKYFDKYKLKGGNNMAGTKHMI